MKLREHIDLDELLLNPVLFVFILSSFQFVRGSPLLGSPSTKKTPVRELTFEYHYNKCRKLTGYIMVQDVSTKKLLLYGIWLWRI